MPPVSCLILPFYNRFEQVSVCLSRLLEQAEDSLMILLVDDGSEVPADSDPGIRAALSDRRVTLLRHEQNRGIAVARNTALRWCRSKGVELVIMIDSDCEPSPDFISEHLRLHREHPDAACIGGGVHGRGKSLWAKLDKVMTWVHSMPYGEPHEVEHPYHLPTTNFSVKSSALPDREEIFNVRLATGEDALLVRELRHSGKRILFSPTPVILHNDRETLGDVVRHHYAWGAHQYFVQMGGDCSPRCFRLWYRIPFAFLFFFSLPFYALLGSFLNIRPWLRHKPSYVLFYPMMLGLWICKGVSVLEAAIRPARVLR